MRNTVKPKRKTDYDAVVVGAGPAGCMASYNLNSNFRVLLIDSSSFPREKSCGGALNSYSYRLIKNLNPPKNIFVKPELVSFRYVDWQRKIKRPTTLQFRNVSRKALDDWLINLIPKNVDISHKTTLKNFDCSKEDKITVHLKRNHQENEVTTRFLVGAGGARSPARKNLTGLIHDCYRVAQSKVEKRGELEPFFDCILGALNSNGNGYIYSYIMPKGDLVLIGSVFHPKAKGVVEKHEKILEEFRSTLKAIGPTVKLEASRALRITSRRDLLLGRNNVLLAGEEAGFISPTSGEGISYALNSGVLCAQAINEAESQKTDSALELYQQKTKKLIRSLRRKTLKLPIIEKPLCQRLMVYIPENFLSRLTTQL